jgi:hypothetical protein
MTPDALLTELRAVLAAERDAIRGLDSAAIVTAAQKKEALLAIVTSAGEAERPAFLRALVTVREDLKRNLVLLAHARDFARDALARSRPQVTLTGARVSVQL